jgi:hypothetical protein
VLTGEKKRPKKEGEASPTNYPLRKVDPMLIITANKYTQDWQPPKAPSIKIG